ncbi:MAG: DUF58 domain-containing protein [Acidimicrobiia bacterium]|nr:DUF58 domain-containing protein [Acidimicrobiia bacterium]
MWTGGHASLRRGESLDFADYREYTLGDDFRRIDHSLWARLGVVLVRLFEAEDEMPVRLVLDRSASMGFGSKFEVARKLAGVIAYLALVGGDRVYPYATPGVDGRAFLPAAPIRHVGGWPQLERWLENLEPTGTDRLIETARSIAGQGAVRGPTVVISDLMARDWEAILDRLGLGNGGAVLHVLSPDELDPDLSGDLRLVDAETGATSDVSTSPETMATYRAVVDRFIEDAAGRARRRGLEHVLVPATPDAVERTLATLATRQVVR